MRTIVPIAGAALLVATLGMTTARAQEVDQIAAANAQAARAARAAKKVSAEQLDNVESRVATAQAIVERLAADAKHRGYSAAWRQASLEMLLPLSLSQLRTVEARAYSAAALSAAVAAAGDDPSVLGHPSRDLVYTPITPCRFIDTRNVGGKITGDRPYSLHVSGASHGGSGACDMATIFAVGPDSLGALAMNVTIVDTSTGGAPGFLAVKPLPSSPTTSLLNWYEAGPSVQVANQGIVSIAQDTGNPFEFVITTSGAVHVIVDIFGAFIAPQATTLDVQLVQDSTTILNGESLSQLSGNCPSGYTAIAGSCSTGTIGMELRNSALFINSWLCTYRNASGGSANFTSMVICARVPGR